MLGCYVNQDDLQEMLESLYGLHECFAKQLKQNRADNYAGRNVPFIIFILIEVALVQDVVSQKRLLFIQLWVIPVVP